MDYIKKIEVLQYRWGLSQAKMGKILGVTKPCINNWIRRSKSISKKNEDKIDYLYSLEVKNSTEFSSEGHIYYLAFAMGYHEQQRILAKKSPTRKKTRILPG